MRKDLLSKCRRRRQVEGTKRMKAVEEVGVGKVVEKRAKGG